MTQILYEKLVEFRRQLGAGFEDLLLLIDAVLAGTLDANAFEGTRDVIGVTSY